MDVQVMMPDGSYADGILDDDGKVALKGHFPGGTLVVRAQPGGGATLARDFRDDDPLMLRVAEGETVFVRRSARAEADMWITVRENDRWPQHPALRERQ